MDSDDIRCIVMNFGVFLFIESDNSPFPRLLTSVTMTTTLSAGLWWPTWSQRVRRCEPRFYFASFVGLVRVRLLVCLGSEMWKKNEREDTKKGYQFPQYSTV